MTLRRRDVLVVALVGLTSGCDRNDRATHTDVGRPVGDTERALRPVLAREALSARILGAAPDQQRSLLASLTQLAPRAASEGLIRVATARADPPDSYRAPETPAADLRAFDGLVDPPTNDTLLRRLTEEALRHGPEAGRAYLAFQGLDSADLANVARNTAAAYLRGAPDGVGDLLRLQGLAPDLASGAIARAISPTAEAMVAATLRDRAELPPAVSNALVAAMAKGEKLSQDYAQAVRSGTQTYAAAAQDFARKYSEARSAAAIGGFILGDLLGDHSGAARLQRSVQVAEIAFQTYLAFATGGLSALSGTATVLSAAGALKGVFGGGGDEVMGQVMAAIEVLRREMHERFDRLEALERQAIELLVGIDAKLDRVALDLSGLKTDLGQLSRYERRHDQQVLLAQLNRDLSTVRGVLASRGPVTDLQRHDALAPLVLYAKDQATNDAFLGDSQLAFSAIYKAGRADLAATQLAAATEALGIPHARVDANPVEWSRGASAYAEARKLIFAPRSDLEDLAHEVRDLGARVNSNLLAATESTALRTAAATLAKRADGLTGIVTAEVKALTFGRRLSAKASAGRHFDNPQQIPKLVLMRRGAHEPELDPLRWTYVVPPDDALKVATARGLISLKRTGAVTADPIYPGVSIERANLPRGVRRHAQYSLLGRDGQLLGQIRHWQIEFSFPQANYEVWEPLGWPEPQIESMLAAIAAQVHDTPALTNFCSNPAHLRTEATERFFQARAAAALVSALATWRQTGRQDDPRYAAALARVPRDVEELSVALTEALDGLNAGDIARLRWKSGAQQALVARLRAAAAPLEREDAARIKAGKAPELKTVRWTDLGELVRFADLVDMLVAGWADSARSGLEAQARGLGDARFSLLDRSIRKLSEAMASPAVETPTRRT